MDPRPEQQGVARATPAVGLLVFGALAHRYLAYTNDDAYITFRYSANLALGRGPYFNPGEHVEGYTNFLWMLIGAGLYRLLGHDALPVAARALELAATAGALLLGGGLAVKMGEGRGARAAGALGLAAVGLAAVSPGFQVNALSGLETGLYALLVGAGVALAVRAAEGQGRWGWALAFALAGLTRPEGVLLGGLTWVVLQALRLRRVAPVAPGWARRAAVEALVVGGTFALHTGLRMALYDGDWLPNTYYAKLGGFGGVAPLPYLWGGLAGPLLGPPGALLAVVGLWRLLRARPSLAPAVAVALTGALLPLVTGADWMPGTRLVMPYLPVITAVAVGAWAGLADALSVRLSRAAPALLLLTVPLSGLLQAADGARLADEIDLRARGYDTGHRALADWILARSEPGDAVSLMDVGIVGYQALDHRVIDLSGLTDRFVAHSPGLFLEKRYDPAYILDQKPRFIVLVYYTDGTSYTPPSPGSAWRAWTTTEEAIYDDPRFQANYTQELPAERTGTWVGGVAKGLGAAMAFEHGHLGVNYLLVVFERREGP